MKKAVSLLLVLVLILSLGLTGCSGENKSTADSNSIKESTEGSSTAENLEKRTDLNIILPGDFTTLDPHKTPSMAEINFLANIFDSLVVLDENGEVIPSLAKEWDISEDGKEYTFYLEEGVKFHNGEELKASDVKFTVERYIGEPWMAYCSFMIDSADVIDDYTVKINLKDPYGLFLSMLPHMYVVNEKTVNEMGDSFAENPIGTGPYKFVKWDVAQQIQLTAFDEYFEGAPFIKDLTFKIIPDANTAFVALETGEADLSFNVGPMDIETAKVNSNLIVDETTSNTFYYVSFNSDKIDKNVRKALSYAIDINSLHLIVTEGKGKVSLLPLIEGQEGYTTDINKYEYNPDKAKQLLAEAGYADGLTLIFFYGESSANSKLGQALQAMFAKIGVTLELSPVEIGTWWTLLEAGEYDITRGGYPMEAANTDSPYFDMYHSTGSFNLSRVRNPKIDQLLENARKELDSNKRDEMYKEINQILTDEAYFIPTYFSASTIVYNSELKGVSVIKDQKYLYNKFSW